MSILYVVILIIYINELSENTVDMLIQPLVDTKPVKIMTYIGK